MRTLFSGAALVIALAAATSVAPISHAAELTVRITDPAGDATGPIDATNLVLVFDPATGDYKITVTATNAQPFDGEFRIAANLFNAARLPTNSLFNHAIPYNLIDARTKIIARGNNAALKDWMPGDVVATNTAASGGVNPPNVVLYRTSVASAPYTYLTNEDGIAYGPGGTATVAVQTPAGAISGLMDDIISLREDGVLTRNQAQSLLGKLSTLLATVNKGGTAPACGQMQAFVQEVQSLVAAQVLHPKQGYALVQAALAAMSTMGC